MTVRLIGKKVINSNCYNGLINVLTYLLTYWIMRTDEGWRLSLPMSRSLTASEAMK